MGPETKKFVGKLGSLMRTVPGETRSTDYLLHKMSNAIQKGNAERVTSWVFFLIIPNNPTKKRVVSSSGNGTLARNRVDDFYLL